MADSTPTYYDVLRLERHAAPEQVRSAYRKLAQKYHPDKMPDNANAARAMAAINAAYEVLSDSHRRAEHDLWIRRCERGNQPLPVVAPVPSTLWAFVHPARHWAWYLLFGTLLFVMFTIVSAVYLTAMPARAAVAKGEPCNMAAPQPPSHCSSR